MSEGYFVEREPAGVYLGHADMAPARFNLQYDGWPFLEEVIQGYRREKGLPESREFDDLGSGLKGPDRAVIGARFAELMKIELSSRAGPFGISVAEKPPNIDIDGSGVGVCGPVGLDLVTLYGFAITAADHIVTWAALAKGLRTLMRRLQKVARVPIELDTGTAIIIAADEIQRQTGERFLTLAFSVEIAGAMCEEDMSGNHDGFAVGFRDRASLRVAVMDVVGGNAVVHLVPMLWGPK